MLCDLCNITLNKNAVFGDSSALSPGGVRIGQYLFLTNRFIAQRCLLCDVHEYDSVALFDLMFFTLLLLGVTEKERCYG
jgi:hypothetical protein